MAATQPKTSFNMDDNPARKAGPIKPLATGRTRGDAIYSDCAFEICMPHVVRRPQRVLCWM